MSYTTNRLLEKPAHNAYIDTWEIPVNSNSDIIDGCFGTTKVINLTGLSTYTLLALDLQSVNIKFTGTLNTGPVLVKMTVGIGGRWPIVNATTQTDATSLLTLSWTSGGTSYVVPQSCTIPMIADSVATSWYAFGPPALPLIVNINISTIPDASIVALTAAQAAASVIVLSGACPATFAGICPPVGVYGSWDVIGGFTTSGGLMAFFSLVSGGTNVQLLTTKNYRIAVPSSGSVKAIAGPT